MHNSLFNRILFFSAGVNPDLIKHCPRSEFIKYTSIGATVIFTALLAIVSSFFAFHLIVNNLLIKLILSFFWGAMIFNLDRFLVSSIRGKSWTQFLPRILLAFFIALVISKPIELKLFEPEINRYLNKVSTDELELVDLNFDNKLKEINESIEDVRLDLESKFELKEKYYFEYKCECDGTCGTGLRGRGAECDRKREKYEAFNLEYEALKVDSKERLNAYEEEKKLVSKEREKKIQEVKTSFTFGLLARLNALSEMPGYYSWAIMFIFMLIETAPVFTKMMSSKGPYEILLQETEYSYNIKYLNSVNEKKREFLKNQKIQETKGVDERIDIIKQRHEKMKVELKQKLKK